MVLEQPNAVFEAVSKFIRTASCQGLRWLWTLSAGEGGLCLFRRRRSGGPRQKISPAQRLRRLCGLQQK